MARRQTGRWLGSIGHRLDVWLVWVLWWRALVYASYFWVIWIQRRRRHGLLWCFLSGVRRVRVLVGLDGLDDAQRMVFGELGLGSDFGVIILPYRHDLEEGRCREEGISGLPASGVRSEGRQWNYVFGTHPLTLFSAISLSALARVCRANCSQYALATVSSSKASSFGFSAFACSSFSMRSVV